MLHRVRGGRREAPTLSMLGRRSRARAGAPPQSRAAREEHREPRPTPYGRVPWARLARRDHSEDRRSGAPCGATDSREEEIEETVGPPAARPTGLDDAGFGGAPALLACMAHAGMGRNRVRLELRKKGVKRSVAEAQAFRRGARRWRRRMRSGWRRPGGSEIARGGRVPRHRLRKALAFLLHGAASQPGP